MKDVRKKKPRSQNARVHGLHAKDFLLPWDSKDEFVKMHEDLKVEWFPRGRAEEEGVLDLAIAHWNKHTHWRMRQSAVLKDPFTSDIVQTGRTSWQGIRKQLRASARSADSLQNVAKDILSSLRSELEQVQREIGQTSDREEIKKLEHKMGAFVRLLADHVAPFLLLVTQTQAPTAEKAFDNAYAPESMEKLVRLEAAHDARIAKILARLVGLKEFKRTPAGAAAAQLEVNPHTRAGQSHTNDGNDRSVVRYTNTT
jgi:hypothetical protein